LRTDAEYSTDHTVTTNRIHFEKAPPVAPGTRRATDEA
jgi:hypothetical protein